MFFSTDFNKVLQIEDAKEYLEGVHRDIMPLLENMIRGAARMIKEVFAVEVFETMGIRRHPNPRPNAKTLREKYNLEDRMVSCQLTGKILKEGYPNVAHNRVWKMHPSYLGFHEKDGFLDVQFDPFSSGRHDEKFVAVVERFFRDNWKDMRDFLPFLADYKARELVKSTEIDDVWKFVHTIDGYTALTFVCGGVELEDIQDIRDLEEADTEQILGLFVESIVRLYPFLHACVCLAKGESTDSFFVMLEKLKILLNQTENTPPDSVTHHSSTTTSVESNTARTITSIKDINIEQTDTAEDIVDFDELTQTSMSGMEGRQSITLRTRYERNPKLREACIREFGVSCVVCECNFEERYGDIGKDFIHVHHREYLTKGGERETKHTKLCPVCPNCHAMIHKSNLTPEQLKEMLETARRKHGK
jgi:hypothetical protein